MAYCLAEDSTVSLLEAQHVLIADCVCSSHQQEAKELQLSAAGTGTVSTSRRARWKQAGLEHYRQLDGRCRICAGQPE